ncbi:uncharacterized protein LOC109833093 [Asparagus officinalis]|uniref:uncharacterized protein LOC109833093 n=1 Tax=Asparagus officinalis TaxID=4686 RepID=UPI00098E18CE|nr:uncharacterized protein LOC109833093 [Asparagus officinalis]
MPSKRERLARFISRLRSKRTGSSLVVQTGFPTSLADLVVKNRAKFQKRRKPSNASEIDAASTAAVRSESDGSVDRLVTAVETPNEIDKEVRVPMRRRGDGLGLGFLMVKVAALVVLAFGRKWVVAGITILAFGVLVIELIGVRLLKLDFVERNAVERFDLRGRGLVSPTREVEVDDHQRSECLDSRSDDLKTVIEGFDLRERELVSPIREIEPKNHLNPPQTERNLGNPEDRRVFVAAESVIENQDLGSSLKPERKRLFKKLFRRKNRMKKNENNSSPSSNDSRICNEILTEEEEESNDDDDDGKESVDEDFLSFQDCNEVVEIDTEDINSNDIGDDVCEVKLKRWWKYVFCIVLLSGLLGGKGFALFLTIAWCLLSVSAGAMLVKWKMVSTDRFVR